MRNMIRKGIAVGVVFALLCGCTSLAAEKHSLQNNNDDR